MVFNAEESINVDFKEKGRAKATDMPLTLRFSIFPHREFETLFQTEKLVTLIYSSVNSIT